MELNRSFRNILLVSATPSPSQCSYISVSLRCPSNLQFTLVLLLLFFRKGWSLCCTLWNKSPTESHSASVLPYCNPIKTSVPELSGRHLWEWTPSGQLAEIKWFSPPELGVAPVLVRTLLSQCKDTSLPPVTGFVSNLRKFYRIVLYI